MRCACVALHRIAEDILVSFPTVDKLVSSGKKIFVKCAARATTFKELAPGISLPPEPVLTRWGTRIAAAVYYAENLEAFSTVVNALDPADAASIKVAQEIVKNPSLRKKLAFMNAHFKNLPTTIEKLEAKDRPLTESLTIFQGALQDLKNTPGPIGERVLDKCDAVIKRNPDYKKIEEVADILRGRSSLESHISLNPSEIAALKMAPITSVDVERTFSVLKHT